MLHVEQLLIISDLERFLRENILLERIFQSRFRIFFEVNYIDHTLEEATR